MLQDKIVIVINEMNARADVELVPARAKKKSKRHGSDHNHRPHPRYRGLIEGQEQGTNQSCNADGEDLPHFHALYS